MKSKADEKVKKHWQKYHRVLKRREIRNIVLLSGINGITRSQIMAQLSERGINISKVQLHNYLKE